MSKEYLNGQDLKPEKKKGFESRKNTMLLSVILVLVLALIISLVIILLKSKDKNEETPSTSQSVVVTDQAYPHKTGGLPQEGGEFPSIGTTQTTSTETCPICGSTDFNKPDGEGYKSCKKCDTKWKENGDKILVVQDGEKTEIPVTVTTATTTSRTTTTRKTSTTVTRPPTTTSTTTTKPPSSKVKVGDYIKFGKYEQDNNTSNGKEAIEWLVLDVQGDKTLVISRYGLDCVPYNYVPNQTTEETTWETSTLRKYMNNDFYNTTFSNSEKSRILTTTVKAEDNPINGTDAGKNTQDKVFALSISEANKYFSSNGKRACEPTAYAKARGVETVEGVRGYEGYERNCWWWLRSPGTESYFAATVLHKGEVYSEGHYVDVDTNGAFRPAMWISI